MAKFGNLSKAAEELKKTIVEKDISAAIKREKMTEWLGLAQNPLLSAKQFEGMFVRLQEIYKEEKDDNSIKEQTKSRNQSMRSAVRQNLMKNPSMPKELMLRAAQARNLSLNPSILQNPSIDDDVLDGFFKRQVYSGNGKTYSFVSFGKIMKAQNVNAKLASKWYEELKQFADWSYADNQWYAIVSALVEFDDCPTHILMDIASAPIDGKEGWRSQSEGNRKQAVEHKNSNDDIKSVAYEITQNEEFLPDSVKEMFLF